MRHRLTPAVLALIVPLDEAGLCPRCGGATFYDDDALGRTVVRCWRRQTCQWSALIVRTWAPAPADRVCRRGHTAGAGRRCAACKALCNRRYVTSKGHRIRARVA